MFPKKWGRLNHSHPSYPMEDQLFPRQEIPSWGLTARGEAIPRLESSFSQHMLGTPKSRLTQD